MYGYANVGITFRRDVIGKPAEPQVWIVYDGECPFCSAYVKLVRLSETVGPVELLDSRLGGTLVDEIVAAKLDLDEGMVLKMNGQFYHGHECLNMLALLSTRSTLFNQINWALFRSRKTSRLLYPVLRTGRNTALRLLGRSKIN